MKPEFIAKVWTATDREVKADWIANQYEGEYVSPHWTVAGVQGDQIIFYCYAEQLGYEICVWISDFDPSNRYGGGEGLESRPTLRGIVMCIEGECGWISIKDHSIVNNCN
jgi:hypothetical protein